MADFPNKINFDAIFANLALVEHNNAIVKEAMKAMRRSNIELKAMRIDYFEAQADLAADSLLEADMLDNSIDEALLPKAAMIDDGVEELESGVGFANEHSIDKRFGDTSEQETSFLQHSDVLQPALGLEFDEDDFGYKDVVAKKVGDIAVTKAIYSAAIPKDSCTAIHMIETKDFHKANCFNTHTDVAIDSIFGDVLFENSIDEATITEDLTAPKFSTGNDASINHNWNAKEYIEMPIAGASNSAAATIIARCYAADGEQNLEALPHALDQEAIVQLHKEPIIRYIVAGSELKSAAGEEPSISQLICHGDYKCGALQQLAAQGVLSIIVANTSSLIEEFIQLQMEQSRKSSFAGRESIHVQEPTTWDEVGYKIATNASRQSMGYVAENLHGLKLSPTMLGNFTKAHELVLLVTHLYNGHISMVTLGNAYHGSPLKYWFSGSGCRWKKNVAQSYRLRSTLLVLHLEDKVFVKRV